MNPNAQFERDLEQFLRAEAPASAPTGFHASVMDRARTLRQRPGWATTLPARRFGRGRGMTVLAAAALLLVGAALAAGSGILRLPTVVPPLPSPSLVAVASPDASPGPNESAAPSASPIPVAGPGGVWIPAGSMVTPPQGEHAAVRLQDGRVLVVGGESRAGDFLSAQLYDPASGTWSATADMPGYTGGGAEAVLLRDGTVLVGESVYDPASGTWTSTDSMAPWSAWRLATVTALRDGEALVTKLDDARLYDPATGTWAPTGKMNVFREGAAATLLSDGTVLVAGGMVDVLGLTDSAEVYNPVTGSWTAIANMPAPGGRPATLLRDGKVLVAGTAPADDGGFQGVARVYDPATGIWTELAARPGAKFNSAALLTDGTVLLTQSWQAYEGCVTVDLYDQRTGSWTTVSGIPWCNVSSFTPLLDGTVLVAGGTDCNGDGVCVSNGAAALYVPAGVPLPPLPAFPSAPPPVFPSPTATAIPTPRPTPLPPAAGPVPPNARSWTVTVDNRSSEPAALFVADEDGDALRLVGAATPNVVPAGTTVEVTFLFPVDGGWIYVNPRPGEGGALVNADDIGIPGKILVTADGQVGWLSP